MEPQGSSNENSSFGGSAKQKQNLGVSLLSQGSVEGVFWTMYELHHRTIEVQQSPGIELV